MSDDFSNVEVYGEAGEDGRPANIPEKFWTPGEGDNPASVKWGDMLTEYNYRGKQIGAADGMFGSPESYTKPEFELPEGSDYTLADDDPMLAAFGEFAKERNLSDKAYGDIVNFYIAQKAQEQIADKEFINAEMDRLGPNGKGMEMVKQFQQQVENWTKDMPEAERDAIRKGSEDAMYTAESFQFLKFLADRSRPAQLPDGDTAANSGISADDVRRMQTEVVADGPNKGKRRYEVDAAFRKEVQTKWMEVAGSGQKLEEVGLPGR